MKKTTKIRPVREDLNAADYIKKFARFYGFESLIYEKDADAGVGDSLDVLTEKVSSAALTVKDDNVVAVAAAYSNLRVDTGAGSISTLSKVGAYSLESILHVKNSNSK